MKRFGSAPAAALCRAPPANLKFGLTSGNMDFVPFRELHQAFGIQAHNDCGQAMSVGTRRMALAALACLLIGGAWYFQYSARRTLHEQLLVDARAALAAGNNAEAESLARRVIAAGGDAADSRLLAGEAAVGQGAGQRALAYLEPLLDGNDTKTVTALGAAANIHWEQGDLTQAEECLRRLLKISPENTYATARLAYLLTLTGRHWESLPLRLSLIKRDSFEFEDLLLWGNARALVETDELKRLRELASGPPADAR